MTLTFPRLLAAAWWLFRRERALVVAVAAPFLFLPAYALLLLADPLPALPSGTRDEAAMERWVAQATQWAGANGAWYLAADAIELFGVAALAVLLVGHGRPTAAEALKRAGTRFLPVLVVGIVSALAVAAGLWLFVLPGLYLQARLVAALPALAAERGRSGPAALLRSLQLTRGNGLALTGATVTLFLAQWLAVAPLLTADGWLRISGHENPVLLALIDAAIALLAAAWRLALLLLGVVAYRVLASRGT